MGSLFIANSQGHFCSFCYEPIDSIYWTKHYLDFGYTQSPDGRKISVGGLVIHTCRKITPELMNDLKKSLEKKISGFKF